MPDADGDEGERGEHRITSYNVCYTKLLRELIVSGVAASRGNPGLAVGNAIGSNIANIGLILGLTAIVYPLRVESETLKREYPVLTLIVITSYSIHYTKLYETYLRNLSRSVASISGSICA